MAEQGSDHPGGVCPGEPGGKRPAVSGTCREDYLKLPGGMAD